MTIELAQSNLIFTHLIGCFFTLSGFEIAFPEINKKNCQMIDLRLVFDQFDKKNMIKAMASLLKIFETLLVFRELRIIIISTQQILRVDYMKIYS